MKKIFFTLSFISVFMTGYSTSSLNHTTSEDEMRECKRATLSCGVSGVACAETMAEVEEIIERAEAHFCD